MNNMENKKIFKNSKVENSKEDFKINIKEDKLEAKILASLILKENTENKKNLIITGSRNIGKSYILNHLIEELFKKPHKNFLMVKTFFLNGKDLYLDFIREDNGTRILKKFLIASKENGRMNLIDDFFNKIGINILDEIIASDIQEVIIDEVGFLEMTSSDYMSKLNKIMDIKNMIIVKRLENSALDKYLINRDDFYLVNLDNYYR